MRHFIPFISILLLLAACSGQEQGEQQSIQADSLNALADASSPYLRQHADNPVNWMEWGDEALDKANEEDKPLLISIGYAACHWCHVMERKSFKDSTVAAYMNEHFIPVKVDREERPDVDQIYMDAARMITGSGGWPLNAFALPDGRPFYAGTYFPKDKWMKVMQTMHDYYSNKKEKVLKQANSLAKEIQEDQLLSMKGDTSGYFTVSNYQKIFEGYNGRIDYDHGGFSGTPKFPLPSGWEFLLQYYYRTGNQKALEAVTTTLKHMARGAIYDQVGGGFSRYSTDDEWKIPHFEKMLYDNGQLTSLYAHAFQITENPLYEEIIRRTLEFIEREMTAENGGFYSSLNADSEGEEGSFYVWTADEIDEALDASTAALFKDYYNISKSGNWEEGRNVLHRSENDGNFLQKHNLRQKEWNSTLKKAHSRLFSIRSERPRPSLDDKILTAWNALMMQGYIDAYRALGDEQYLESAVENARFLHRNMMEDGGELQRSMINGQTDIPGYLIDYATLSRAYISLYEVTFDKKWLDRAREIADYVLTHFSDENSPMLYYTSDQSEELIARKKEITDNVLPSSNSVMAHALFRLGHYYYKVEYIDRARSMVEAIAGEISKNGPYFSNWASLAGLITAEPFNVAVVGEEAMKKSLALQRKYLPTSFFLGGETEHLSLLKNKKVEGITRIYVCKQRLCKKPVEQVDKALQQIRSWE